MSWRTRLNFFAVAVVVQRQEVVQVESFRDAQCHHEAAPMARAVIALAGCLEVQRAGFARDAGVEHNICELRQRRAAVAQLWR
jgi:hypothetical protein